MSQSNHNAYRFLDTLERIGNKLPDPAALFFISLIIIMLLSHVAQIQQWSVVNTSDASIITAKSLLDAEGIWWLLSHLVENFIQFQLLKQISLDFVHSWSSRQYRDDWISKSCHNLTRVAWGPSVAG